VALYPERSYRNPQSWPACVQLTPHLLALRSACPDDPQMLADLADVLGRAGSYFYGRADYSQAAQLARDALAVREKVLGSEHPATAESLNNLGLALDKLGNYAAARPLHERALAIYEKTLSPDHPDTAMSVNNLAMVLENLGDYAAARPLYLRSLAIYEKALGPDHPDLGRAEEAKALRERYGVTEPEKPQAP
jgi:tetratricopeptide (TPR) repeat protein